MRLKTNCLTGDLDAYTRLSPKLKMGTIEDEFSRKTSLSSPQSQQGVPEMDVAGQVKTGLPTMYSAEKVHIIKFSHILCLISIRSGIFLCKGPSYKNSQ